MTAKRCFDLVLVVLSAPLWLPLLGVVALLVRVKLGAPVLFRQDRPGLNGRVFRLIKFRTMTDACDASGQPLPDEQRLHSFGRGLRSTSLDELPELMNVLRGEMSLVGPRPLLVRYLPRYTPEQARRHDVLPGLTGWAQIHGRNATTWEERLRFDVWYADHRTLWLDVKILFATVWLVLSRRGVSNQGEFSISEFWGTQKPGESDRPSERSGPGSRR